MSIRGDNDEKKCLLRPSCVPSSHPCVSCMLSCPCKKKQEKCMKELIGLVCVDLPCIALAALALAAPYPPLFCQKSLSFCVSTQCQHSQLWCPSGHFFFCVYQIHHVVKCVGVDSSRAQGHSSKSYLTNIPSSRLSLLHLLHSFHPHTTGIDTFLCIFFFFILCLTRRLLFNIKR